MPGGIDPHTHLEMPFMGTTSADDYESGTKAALSGGTTMVVDFCIPTNGQPLLEAWADWDKKSKTACTDYSYHMCITYWSEKVRDEMAEVVKRGVTTFKHFMAYKGALMVNDDEMFASFRRCAELGAMPLVHAENGDVVAALQAEASWRMASPGPRATPIRARPRSRARRPNRAIMIADMAGVPLYIVHVSCIPAHHAIARARAEGKRVYGEPLIQHLVLDETRVFQHGLGPCGAPRDVAAVPRQGHQEDLWNGLRAGSLQVVATDHCAFTTEQKRSGRDDFTRIPNGTGGLEDRMPVLWTHGVGTGRLTMNEFVAVTSTNIAQDPQHLPEEGRDRWPAATPNRGLGPEGDEDDQREDAGVGDRLQRLRGRRRSTGLPRTTLSRGEVVYDDGKIERQAGARPLRPARPPTLRSPARDAAARWKPTAIARAREGARRPAGARDKIRHALMLGTDHCPASRSELPAVPASRAGLGAARGHRIDSRPVADLRRPPTVRSTRCPNIDLAIDGGEFVSLIGPSGCGKTTLLRVIADLETADGGTITRQRRHARTRRGSSAPTATCSRRRRCIPGARSRKNIALPLEIMGFSARSARARVAQDSISSTSRASSGSFPGSCRAACSSAPRSPARSSFDPDLLLMDEPFGALDEIVRDKLNEQLLRLWDKTRKTVVFVTHSIPEAVFLSTQDRRDVAAARAHPRRHRLRLAARPHARHPRNAGVPRAGPPRAAGPAQGPFLCRLSARGLARRCERRRRRQRPS